MKFHVLTLFPEAFGAPLRFSIVGRAVGRGLAAVEVSDLRGFTRDAHGTADDYQFGGGHGMVMKPEPVFEAADAALSGYDSAERDRIPVILFTPQGELLTQRLVEELAGAPAIVLVCGHYAGVDERVAEGLATRQVSVGDYVLTGGELPAMLVIDAVTRLLPGVAGPSHAGDSITTGLLQHPLYTRPAEYRGMAAPAVLLSGHHGEIARWRRRRSLERTLARRPDLLATADLSADDRAYLAQLAESADLAGGDRADPAQLAESADLAGDDRGYLAQLPEYADLTADDRAYRAQLSESADLTSDDWAYPAQLSESADLAADGRAYPAQLSESADLASGDRADPAQLSESADLTGDDWADPAQLSESGHPTADDQAYRAQLSETADLAADDRGYPAQLSESAPDNLGRRGDPDDSNPGEGKGVDGDGLA